MKNGFALSTFAALSAITLAACTSASSSSTGNGTTSDQVSTGVITIGAALSLTGDRQVDGIAFRRGYELWAADVNAAGGIQIGSVHRKVKLTFLDDKSDQNTVVAAYQTLFGKDHVDLAFGPFSTLLTGPASAVAARFGMALLEGAGGGPAVFDTPSNQADHNVFDVSLPVADSLLPFVNWIGSLPPAQRQQLTAAYPMAQDPFADPPVQLAQTELLALGVKTVYSQTFPELAGPNFSAYKTPADAVAAANPDIVILGSPDVPTVQEFMQAFEQRHYNPRMFVAAAGPDQGAAFTSVVGAGNANGMMVPDGWYPGFDDPVSKQMVAEYVREYGGSPGDVNADVAEAYAVGQVAAQAVTATGGTDNQKIISYLHSGVTLRSVQGPVHFDALGENGAASAFVFQWQHGDFHQVLPLGFAGSDPITATKPHWTS